MTWATWFAISVAGGVGAAARYGADAWLRTRVGRTLPWSTIVINVVGSLALGLLVGVVSGTDHADRWWVDTIGIGLLGGFTTFSTISVETVALMRERRYVAGITVALGMLAVSACAAALGAGLGHWSTALC